MQSQVKEYQKIKKEAHDDAIRILEEEEILKEKANQYNIVKNRVAYLRKRINDVNKQIDKQDNLIDKIKNNQDRYVEQTEKRL